MRSLGRAGGILLWADGGRERPGAPAALLALCSRELTRGALDGRAFWPIFFLSTWLMICSFAI